MFRVGLTPTLELQLSGSPWNRVVSSGGGIHDHAEGAGDSAIGLKWAPSLASKNWSLAVLGVIGLATGARAFTAGTTVTSLGVAATDDLGNNRSFEVYGNVDHAAGRNTLTLAANFGFPIHGDISGFAEVGHVAGGGLTQSLLGGGLTWMLHERVQFDLYADRGLTRRGTDALAGFGISVFFGK